MEDITKTVAFTFPVSVEIGWNSLRKNSPQIGLWISVINIFVVFALEICVYVPFRIHTG